MTLHARKRSIDLLEFGAESACCFVTLYAFPLPHKLSWRPSS